MWCRWLNADSINYLNIIDINGTNLYQYCSNNPVMYVDPDGNWALLGWAELLLCLSPAGFAFVGANRAYESSKALNKGDWETFGWTISGIFVGNYGVVAANWDEVSETIEMDPNQKYNFKFENNNFYSFWTSGLYASYLKENYYSNENSRTSLGLNLELLVHYILYAFGNEHGTNGANMGPANLNDDPNAILFELIPFILRFFWINRLILML